MVTVPPDIKKLMVAGLLGAGAVGASAGGAPLACCDSEDEAVEAASRCSSNASGVNGTLPVMQVERCSSHHRWQVSHHLDDALKGIKDLQKSHSTKDEIMIIHKHTLTHTITN